MNLIKENIERFYAPSIPMIYSMRKRGAADIINMCFECPKAPECSEARGDSVKMCWDPAGCTREDIPDGKDTFWWALFEGKPRRLDERKHLVLYEHKECSSR